MNGAKWRLRQLLEPLRRELGTDGLQALLSNVQQELQFKQDDEEDSAAIRSFPCTDENHWMCKTVRADWEAAARRQRDLGLVPSVCLRIYSELICQKAKDGLARLHLRDRTVFLIHALPQQQKTDLIPALAWVLWVFFGNVLLFFARYAAPVLALPWGAIHCVQVCR